MNKFCCIELESLLLLIRLVAVDPLMADKTSSLLKICSQDKVKVSEISLLYSLLDGFFKDKFPFGRSNFDGLGHKKESCTVY